MDFRKLTGRAKKLVDDRGGVDALKADAEGLRKVAQGKGTLADKGKAAAAALREHGAHREAAGAAAAEAPASPAAPAPAADAVPLPDSAPAAEAPPTDAPANPA